MREYFNCSQLTLPASCEVNPKDLRLFRHRHGKEVLSEETGRGKEVIERREVFDTQGIS